MSSTAGEHDERAEGDNQQYMSREHGEGAEGGNEQ